MIEFITERLVAKTEMDLIDSKIVARIPTCSKIDLLNLERSSGRESGFVFYDKTNPDTEICHISILNKRGRFELSFGTNEKYRKKGYMREALGATIDWIFKHTNEDIIWAIPGNNISEKILKDFCFIKKEDTTDLKWFMLSKNT